jgi:predicted nucleic-acid-binding Zn-ribbon protein
MYNSANRIERTGSIMLNGICPKCQSTEVYIDTNVSTFVTTPYNILNQVAVKNGILAPHNVRFNNFLCANCGYLERYVTNRHDRQRLTEHWERVGQEQTSR